MGNISIKINLKQLKHVERELKGAAGKPVKCLVIPIKENNFFEGEKGTYLDLTAIEIKNKVGNSKDTHLVKQSLEKELYNSMSTEQQRAMPILGNAILWGRQEAEPQTSSSFSDSAVDKYDEDFDDLPF